MRIRTLQVTIFDRSGGLLEVASTSRGDFTPWTVALAYRYISGVVREIRRRFPGCEVYAYATPFSRYSNLHSGSAIARRQAAISKPLLV